LPCNGRATVPKSCRCWVFGRRGGARARVVPGPGYRGRADVGVYGVDRQEQGREHRHHLAKGQRGAGVCRIGPVWPHPCANRCLWHRSVCFGQVSGQRWSGLADCCDRTRCQTTGAKRGAKGQLFRILGCGKLHLAPADTDQNLAKRPEGHFAPSGHFNVTR